MFSPRDAMAAGFLDQVVAADDLASTTMAAAQALTKINLDGHAATKKRLRGAAAQAVRSAIDAGIAA
jgi:enoyl-CoA hydratase